MILLEQAARRWFVEEGCPVALRAEDHRLLADHFGVEERGLGIRDLWAPHRVR